VEVCAFDQLLLAEARRDPRRSRLSRDAHAAIGCEHERGGGAREAFCLIGPVVRQ